MGHLLSAILLAISSNVDNFAVGIAYGVKKLKIGFLSNLAIAVVSAFGTYISMTLGAIIGQYLSDQVANLLGSGVLVLLGVWGIVETLRMDIPKVTNRVQTVGDGNIYTENKDNLNADKVNYATYVNNPEKVDLDSSRSVDVKESIILAFSLTINNVFSGIGAGISKIDINLTTTLTFILSMLVIIVGYFLGDNFTTKMPVKLAGFLSAGLIIAVGVYEYFN